MAETLYEWLITDTLYDSVAVDRLANDITDHPWITETLVSVVLNGQKIEIRFVAELSDIEESRVDGMVCGHNGVAVQMIMSRPVVGLEVALVGAWATLDGFAFAPASVTATVARLVARLSGEYKAVDAGAELQVVETTDAGDEDKFASDVEIPDTQGVWQTFQVDSDVDLREGTPPNVYRLLGRRDVATSASVRYCELALIWV